MKAKIIIGLSFGDEGKGITTDFLVSRSYNPIVVRFSGGQQAGHTVVADGRKHISASYGAGVLRGIPTYISEYCTFYPNAIKCEWEELREKVKDIPKIYIHPLAKVTTPYDVAWNRYHGSYVKHGTCGMGVGATMKRESVGYKFYAVDLLNKAVAKEKLKEIKKYYESQVHKEHGEEFAKLCRDREDYFFTLLDEELYEVADYSLLGGYHNLIFEGSQGIMLDMDHGIFPHVTYANTTSRNAVDICRKIGVVNPEIFYVTRCYQTRHGKGWISNNDPIDLINNEGEINEENEWQGKFRVGEVDYDLLKHALTIDNLYSGDIRKNLVITCMDQRPGFVFDYERLGDFFRVIHSYSPDSQHFKVTHSKLKILVET
jgi:adenylosuccinate synthase